MVHLKIILAGPAGFRPAGTPALPGVRPSDHRRRINIENLYVAVTATAAPPGVVSVAYRIRPG